MNSFFLFGAPRVLPKESISSWLQRLSQQQGVSLKILLLMLQMNALKDSDCDSFPRSVSNLTDVCRLQKSSFNLVKAINRSIMKTRQLKKQILIGKNREPITAFCAQCIKNDPIPYYRIEWRFLFWKICPHHLTEMRTTCPSCSGLVTLNRSILVSNTPSPSLAYCQYCFSNLAKVASKVDVVDDSLYKKLSLQNNMMASVTSGYCLIAPMKEKFRLHVLIRLYQIELLESARKDDFAQPYSHKQKLALQRLLKKMQIKIRVRELLHE